MKISAFHLMPHRELPADFEARYPSVWVTPPWWELADARRVGQYYNWTLDELLYAARAGFDGVCTNEHHQNAYGFMPSPNLMGSVLARGTQGMNVAIVQMGATLPTSNPPIRVAEEYAMLDCISGGRLVAGLQLRGLGALERHEVVGHRDELVDAYGLARDRVADTVVEQNPASVAGRDHSDPLETRGRAPHVDFEDLVGLEAVGFRMRRRDGPETDPGEHGDGANN